MVPAVLGWIAAVPTTPNGKIDHAALPDLRIAGQAVEKVAPRTDLERRIAEFVAGQLGLEELGVLDDLGRLGLHSVLAMRLSAHLKQAHGAEVPVSLLLVNPTVERIAQAVAGE
jgi:aryl carrier-like protein